LSSGSFIRALNSYRQLRKQLKDNGDMLLETLGNRYVVDAPNLERKAV
jgi:hypothetical protein